MNETNMVVREKLRDYTQAYGQEKPQEGLQVIKVGLLGLGTVGTGVYRIIEQHQEELKHQTGCTVAIQKILVQSLSKERSVDLDPLLLTTDVHDLLDDPEISMIIEVMGGVEIARTYIAQALDRNKHVVTANKDLMAEYGVELLAMARARGCDLFYEASVAGGIPILRALVEGFASDRIHKMMGILNGTTNYMLTRMTTEGLSYESCLQQAQELGYAEADPTSDVEGLDAARKLAILGTLGFHTPVSVGDVHVTGITQVTKEDIQYGREFGYELKLLGIAERKENEIELSVQPTFVTRSHPLASVNGVNNAVYVYGEAVGETMFYGPGAGELPTATAIVSDLVTVVKNFKLGVNGRSMVPPYRLKLMKPKHRILNRYFIRMVAQDEAGVLASITHSLAKQEMSISTMLQKPLDEQQAEIVLVTHTVSLQALENWLKEVQLNLAVCQVVSYYAVEGEH